MSMNEKALQAILSACDDREHIGDGVFRFTFDDSFVEVEIQAEATARKGWRVTSVEVK